MAAAASGSGKMPFRKMLDASIYAGVRLIPVTVASQAYFGIIWGG
jgi:hypothetical protein